MKEVNFRIIELPTHQVLLAKDFDDDEDNISLITITFFIDNVKVCQKYGYESESKRDETFDSITDNQVQNILDYSLKMFNND